MGLVEADPPAPAQPGDGADPPIPAHRPRRWVWPLGVALTGALVAGAVALWPRDPGPDRGWTPVSGFEELPSGMAAVPEEQWRVQLTPTGGLNLDLELSPQGAWALSQGQQEIVLARLDLATGDRLWETQIHEERSILFELELFGDDEALALSYEPAAGQTHIELRRTTDGDSFWEEDSADSLFLVTEGFRQPLLDGLLVFSVGPESVAVEPATGHERWRAPLFPLVREGQLLASTREEQARIGEVDPATGVLRWRTPISIPLVANGVLFLIGETDIDALELGSGRHLWSRPGAGPIFPATTETVVLVQSTEVIGLDPATGEIDWRTDIDLRQLANPSANPVVIDGEHLLVVPTADRIILLRGRDGSEIGRASLPPDAQVLAFAEGTIYVGAADQVHAYSLPDLEPLWSTELDQTVTQLVPVDDGLLVATRDTLSLLGAAGS